MSATNGVDRGAAPVAPAGVPDELTINGVVYRRPTPLEDRLTALERAITAPTTGPATDTEAVVKALRIGLVSERETLRADLSQIRNMVAGQSALPASVYKRLEAIDGVAAVQDRILATLGTLAGQVDLIVGCLDSLTAPVAPPSPAPEVQAPPTPFRLTPGPDWDALLREYLTTPSLTQADLGQRMGMHQADVSRHLRAKAQATGQATALRQRAQQALRTRASQRVPAGDA